MYLSLLHLNPASAEVQRDLRDVAGMHSRIMQAFPDVLDPTCKARAYFGVLYRIEFTRNGGWLLYVQSKPMPAWDNLPSDYLSLAEGNNSAFVKSVVAAYDSIRAGQLLRFRLKVNVTRKIDTKTGPDGQKRNGRRVAIQQTEAQMDWLLRVAQRSGFEPQQAVIAASGSIERVQSRLGNKTFQGVVFEGVLRVSDPERFQEALVNGIGPGKAYGFGLLSIAPR